METKEELELLQAEILNLFNYIQRVRKEVAAITRTDEGNGRFDNMSDQLDAIVQATEDATNSIMEVVEQNSDTIAKIREKVDDPEVTALLDEVENNSSNIFEACTFQDITGQRVTKIARSVTYVERRVNSLIEIFGKEHLENVDVEMEEKTEDEKLLQGPQLEGGGVTQDEIDKLFD
jgi:chemotaxis protein CheZ